MAVFWLPSGFRAALGKNLPAAGNWRGLLSLLRHFGSRTSEIRQFWYANTLIIDKKTKNPGKIYFDNLKFYESLKDIEHLILEKGDLLFNRTNSYELVGKTSIFEDSNFDKVTFASYLIRIKANKKQVLPRYLNYFLNSPHAESIKTPLKSQQVGQANINGTKLKNIIVPLPSLSLQKQIVSSIESKFSVIDKVEETVNHALVKAERLRKSILKSAFEGKLVKEDIINQKP